MKDLKKISVAILIIASITFLLQTAEGAPLVKSGAFSTDVGYGPITAANYTEIVRLSLPAGKYLIVGKGLVNNQQVTSGTAACNMYSSLNGLTHLDTSDAALPAASIIQTDSYATLAFNAAIDLPTGQDVWIECISTGSDMWASAFRLSALSVGSLTIQ